MLNTQPLQLAYSFDANAQPELTQVGGKALSLMLMTREGLPVPPGFALTVDFFRPWLDEVERSPAWRRFLESPPEQLKTRCDAVKGVCAGLRLTAEQEEAVRQGLAGFESMPSELVLAVRSSSPEEDLEGTSFAGGYETTLGA